MARAYRHRRQAPNGEMVILRTDEISLTRPVCLLRGRALCSQGSCRQVSGANSDQTCLHDQLRGMVQATVRDLDRIDAVLGQESRRASYEEMADHIRRAAISTGELEVTPGYKELFAN
ncbi:MULTISPECIES: hypothetical protein [unclassified Mesorhizobium]|uniref:hypothetical protein n=1 Tax=unclassified Mesorhizobium TaxID=325217 RepID=UPI001140A150|nr:MULTISPECIES: hypothetical protein [unclassified Mesorhizobium]